MMHLRRTYLNCCVVSGWRNGRNQQHTVTDNLNHACVTHLVRHEELERVDAFFHELPHVLPCLYVCVDVM